MPKMIKSTIFTRCRMDFGPEYIKKLLADAHTLLGQDEINATDKAAIENCLKSVGTEISFRQSEEKITGQ